MRKLMKKVTIELTNIQYGLIEKYATKEEMTVEEFIIKFTLKALKKRTKKVQEPFPKQYKSTNYRRGSYGSYVDEDLWSFEDTMSHITDL